MVSFDRIMKEISQEEGVKNTVYKCTAGFRTIAVGHNLDAESIDSIIGRKLSSNPKLSDNEIKIVFEHDLNKVIGQLDRTMKWWKDLPIFAQYCLISLCFNMGIGGMIKRNPLKYNGLLGFTNTLKAFAEERWNDAAEGLESSKWYKQVGLRGPKIVKILKTGKFPDGKSE